MECGTHLLSKFDDREEETQTPKLVIEVSRKEFQHRPPEGPADLAENPRKEGQLHQHNQRGLTELIHDDTSLARKYLARSLTPCDSIHKMIID